AGGRRCCGAPGRCATARPSLTPTPRTTSRAAALGRPSTRHRQVSTAFITIEGVLGDHSPIHGFYPIPDGVKLAHALRSGYQVILGTTQADQRTTEHWLHINGMTRPGFYVELLHRNQAWFDLKPSNLRAEQASYLRSSG